MLLEAQNSSDSIKGIDLRLIRSLTLGKVRAGGSYCPAHHHALCFKVVVLQIVRTKGVHPCLLPLLKTLVATAQNIRF